MRLSLINMRRRMGRDEGYTIVAVVGSIALISTLAGVALAAATGDVGLVRRDLDEKRAFAAAQAGIGDYAFHLNNDNGYWADCTTVPQPHAVNQIGSTANRRFVPGSNDAQYAIELLPRTGHTSCSTSDPIGTMLEQGGASTGTFRIRSTGYAGNASQSVVATFDRASFLDYIYFTQLETSDPITYGNPTTIAAANTQCAKYLREGRQSVDLPNNGGQPCDVIVFVSGDNIRGPLHTNDALQICGTPTFGRGPADPIEVSAPPIPPPQGWHSRCGAGDQPNFVGPPITSAPVLTPPATNGKLRTIAGPSHTYTCQTDIVLNGTTMTINGGSPTPFPTGGVVYVANGDCPTAPACATGYSPFTATYPAASDCGTVRVSGSYSGMLTIAAENDIIIWDDITRTGNGMLGLIANNFVRIRHPICPSTDLNCTTSAQTSRSNCNSGVNGNGSQSNLNIDAAILAISHSFIVDHYNCGAPLGTLAVNGAISQKFRGAVGTGGQSGVTHGYLKDYSYDDRLRAQDPPNFLDPVQSAWHIQRETLDAP